MSKRAWVFLDEQGDVKFGASNSKHFGLAAVTTDDPTGLTNVVDEVRHRWWSNDHLRHGELHAKENCWPVRRDVFDAFSRAPINRIDVVALAKRNVYERSRSPEGMYQAALRILLRFLVPRLPECEELVIVAASWGAYSDVSGLVESVLTTAGNDRSALWVGMFHVMQAPASAHGGLQMADYAAWASHRKRSRGDASHWESMHAAGRELSDFEAF